MEASLMEAAIKYKKDWDLISNTSFSGYSPAVLMTKYEEVLNRDLKDIS